MPVGIDIASIRNISNICNIHTSLLWLCRSSSNINIDKCMTFQTQSVVDLRVNELTEEACMLLKSAAVGDLKEMWDDYGANIVVKYIVEKKLAQVSTYEKKYDVEICLKQVLPNNVKRYIHNVAPGAYYVNTYMVWGLESEVAKIRASIIEKIMAMLGRDWGRGMFYLYFGMNIASK